MSIASGPKIVTDGLIFGYDMYDPQSYRGAALTNQFLVPTPAANGDVTFAANGTGTFKRIYTGTFDNYSITSNDVVYRYDLTAVGGCYYHGNTVTLSAGQYITFTFDYYISPDAQNYPTVNYLGNVEGAVGGSAADPTPTLKGVWKTATIASGVTTAGNYNFLLYPGACNPSYLASSGFILYRNPQVFVTSTSNFTAPFVGPFGSRSSTNSLLDITGNRTITINSLTYASNNTFSFNGTNNYISSSFATTAGQAVTYCGWLYSTETTATYKNFVDSVSANPMIWWNTSGQIEFDSASYTTTPVYRNQWVYVALSKPAGSSSASYYVNGVLVGTGSAYTTPAVTPTWFNRAAGQTWKGDCPAVQVYNVALTAEQVALNFAAMRGKYGV